MMILYFTVALPLSRWIRAAQANERADIGSRDHERLNLTRLSLTLISGARRFSCFFKLFRQNDEVNGALEQFVAKLIL